MYVNFVLMKNWIGQN